MTYIGNIIHVFAWYNCLFAMSVLLYLLFAQDMGTIILGKVESGVISKGQILTMMPNKVRHQRYQFFYFNLCFLIGLLRSIQSGLCYAWFLSFSFFWCFQVLGWNLKIGWLGIVCSFEILLFVSYAIWQIVIAFFTHFNLT